MMERAAPGIFHQNTFPSAMVDMPDLSYPARRLPTLTFVYIRNP